MESNLVVMPTSPLSKSRIALRQYLNKGVFEHTKFVKLFGHSQLYEVERIDLDKGSTPFIKFKTACRNTPLMGFAFHVEPYGAFLNDPAVLAVDSDKERLSKINFNFFDEYQICYFCKHIMTIVRENSHVTDSTCPVCNHSTTSH